MRLALGKDVPSETACRFCLSVGVVGDRVGHRGRGVMGEHDVGMTSVNGRLGLFICSYLCNLSLSGCIILTRSNIS